VKSLHGITTKKSNIYIFHPCLRTTNNVTGWSMTVTMLSITHNFVFIFISEVYDPYILKQQNNKERKKIIEMLDTEFCSLRNSRNSKQHVCVQE
jgi:hypothetical protein